MPVQLMPAVRLMVPTPGGGTVTALWTGHAGFEEPGLTGVLRLDRLSVWLLGWSSPLHPEPVAAAAPDLAEALDRLLTRLPAAAEPLAVAQALLTALP